MPPVAVTVKVACVPFGTYWFCGAALTTIAESISSEMCFESVFDVQPASLTEVMKSVLFDVRLRLRVADFVALVCTKPSDQVMVNGAVPCSVTGMTIVPGPQIDSVAGMLAEGGLLIGMVFVIVVDDDPQAHVSVMTTLNVTLPEVPAVKSTDRPLVGEVNVPFVMDHAYDVPPVALAVPGLFAHIVAGAVSDGATPGGGERTTTVVELLAEQTPEVTVTV